MLLLLLLTNTSKPSELAAALLEDRCAYLHHWVGIQRSAARAGWL